MSSETDTSQEARYELKLSGHGLSLDQAVDRATAVAIVGLVLGEGAPRPAQVGGRPTEQHAADDPSGGSASSAAELSVGEFVAQVEAKRHPDKIVAMGVFLKEQGHLEFTPEDIKPLFQKAGEPTPANFGRDLRWAQNLKWIAPGAANPKAFYVTQAGEKAVRNHFPPEVRKAAPKGSSRKSRKKEDHEASQ